eukprot:3551843-Rhodomonas_salina.1
MESICRDLGDRIPLCICVPVPGLDPGDSGETQESDPSLFCLTPLIILTQFCQPKCKWIACPRSAGKLPGSARQPGH